MQKYKIDWLSFSVKNYDEEPTNTLDENLLELLGYDFADEFNDISGKNFYNRGATLGNYVNIFWNDYTDTKNPVRRNSSATMNVVFTGQGSTDLALRNDNDWFKIFKILTTYEPKIKPKDEAEAKPSVNITRIDIALDDYDELVKFDDIEKKLQKGHYRSSKRSYNIVKTSDQTGQKLGETIYIGNARTASGSRGNTYMRMYDKLAQYLDKNQLVTSDVREYWKKTGKKTWQRYEISISKGYTNSIVEDILKGESIDKIFKTSLRNLIEILTPRGTDTNKNRWYKTKWWEDFLKYDERKDFDLPNRDVMLAETLEWLRVAVLPSLNVLEKIGQERGFDIYDLLRSAKKPNELSKKQSRIIADTRNKSDEKINDYLTKFLLGIKIEKERGGE
ncbi:replication initiation factor domain-containing protein [Lactococcus lactis]|uniref:replication initiation factor domain-containing protein n=1 Tax=Lactococcus lactis TaxID=1358 RepID=UPI00288EC487|nr:replication initiation factor domain-containing protein [Lactococcus lactis]MDT2871654.1 replication initiation factor domain-containing protein [Lactococcus lactis]MDT2917388.1 replication initiation factor domain-containing protein [Lactococcus lactis]MDT2933551.1 replication initiation factor domain-containing protein [Lactococcus lactis]